LIAETATSLVDPSPRAARGPLSTNVKKAELP
jgi:hypothetical protein